MSIIGYARVSANDQSLDIQIEKLMKAGCTKIFREKISGVAKIKPELSSLMEYIREGDTVIVTKLDRIARSTKHLLEIVDSLEEKSVSFRVLNIDLDTSTPTGRLMITMLGAIAAFEREMLRERQAEGIAKAREKGKYKGRKPVARAKTEQIISMTKRNIPRRQIARELGVSSASIYRILKENGVKLPVILGERSGTGEEIASLLTSKTPSNP
ncbi:Resolvase domain protein [Desulfurispirillum indicum S5]|uniref:Resolvase domain protein n=1 Tax=Desulfurispirillum indicum (strain ATCC BAA-1389 / DSM 22839 / S5) TaxID=653733 RepID=E6W6X9_DESIS|nr:recombinase family protein [Desulfurispirillum indicum]ADU66222.1 Resolvase domain protein [Desulfurispirillum indicum S5]